jgi:uncharacterized membrane protein YphA (DoxX/SURF4 family)
MRAVISLWTRAEELELSTPIRQIGTWGVIALMALRFGIGWHFFKEGVEKFTAKGVPTVAFLRGAKGPLAEMYKGFIPDRYGEARLSLKETTAFWNAYKDRVGRHYGFDDAQTKKADEIAKRYVARLEKYLGDIGSEVEEYRFEVDRLKRARQEPESPDYKTKRIPFQKARLEEKEQQLWGQSAVWLADVQTLSVQFEKDLEQLATRDQLARGPLHIPDRSKPGWLDTTIKFLVLGVGILLILGLFTRAAAVGGMMFLCSVITTQPPWVEGANTQYFYYQLVEVLALFVVFVFAAGRYGGLDYLVHGLYRRCCPPNVGQTDK